MQYQTYMQPTATSMPMPFQNGYSTGAVQGFPNFASQTVQPSFASQNIQTFASQPQTFQTQPSFQTQPFASAQFAPTNSAPLTPKLVQSPGVEVTGGTTKVISSSSALGPPAQRPSIPANPTNVVDIKARIEKKYNEVTKSVSAREQALESRARELETILMMKEKKIQELEAELVSFKPVASKPNKGSQSPGRKSNFRNTSEAKPAIRYTPGDTDDPIDVRLAEYYNSTCSAIQFKRINRGFYRFGETIVELDIVNHKLMARTEDGWNRGKLAPIEKFVTQYENIEREKAGILPES